MTDAEPVSSIDDAEANRLLVQGAMAVLEERGKQAARDCSPLPIKSLQWARTVNTAPYESARLSIEVAVATAGAEDSTLEAAQAWVDDHLPDSAVHVSEYLRAARDRAAELRDMEIRLMRAQQQWEKVRVVFERLGIEIPAERIEDLPF